MNHGIVAHDPTFGSPIWQLAIEQQSWPILCVMTDNLATIMHSEVDRQIGTLQDMSQVDRGVRLVLGL